MGNHSMPPALVHPPRVRGVFSRGTVLELLHRKEEPDMTYRVLSILLAVLALAVFVAAPAGADEKKGDTHEGTVVKAGDGKLTMADKDKKEHTHTVAVDAKITIDGKDAKLADLKAGDTIK